MSPSFTVNILVTDNGIQLTRETFDDPSVRISGSLTSIIKTVTKKNAKSAIRETDIKINKDNNELKCKYKGLDTFSVIFVNDNIFSMNGILKRE